MQDVLNTNVEAIMLKFLNWGMLDKLSPREREGIKAELKEMQQHAILVFKKEIAKIQKYNGRY